MDPSLRALLRSVARSFSLSLNVLPAKVRPAMGLGYLLCRAADSIADIPLLPYDQRLHHLRQFKSLFDSFPISMEKVASFQKNLSQAFDDRESDEARLLLRTDRCLSLLKTLNRTEQALAHDVVIGVINGMEMDLTTFGKDEQNLKSFPSEKELETYLGWIGGEPGRFWTKLYLLHYPELAISDKDEWTEKGYRFGTGLQMINILRDLPKDLKNGRCYIPKPLLDNHSLRPNDLLLEDSAEKFFPLYHSLIDDTLDRLKNGLDYLESFSALSLRSRAAVWWPLAIGLKTLKLVRGNRKILDADHVIKVRRGSIYLMLGYSFLLLPFNRLLRWEFEDLSSTASASIT